MNQIAVICGVLLALLLVIGIILIILLKNDNSSSVFKNQEDIENFDKDEQIVVFSEENSGLYQEYEDEMEII